MMTIVTDVRLRKGAEGKWDAVVRKRMAAAKERPGWMGAQLLRSEDQPNRRVIVGTWRTRADWEAWHRDPRFAETRQQLDELVEGRKTRGWHEVVVDVRSGEDQLARESLSPTSWRTSPCSRSSPSPTDARPPLPP